MHAVEAAIMNLRAMPTLSPGMALRPTLGILGVGRFLSMPGPVQFLREPVDRRIGSGFLI